jgi:ATP-binding cassette subfamily F protein 3
LDELLIHKTMDPGAARTHLARYLFSGDEVLKQISLLSGGERARLALAILSLEEANFLLLDEPTNHLDIPAREALEAVLKEFSGTILLVSHDRYLIDQLATQIWELRDSKLLIFRGTYREYILRGNARPDIKPASQILLRPNPMVRDNSQETRRRQQALELVEGRIREQEMILKSLSKELQIAGPKQSYEVVHQLSNQVAQAQAALETLMSEWERLTA